MVPKQTHSESKGQAAVAGILMFNWTRSSLWRPAQRTWERHNMLTQITRAEIIIAWVSHGAKTDPLGMRRSSGSCGSTLCYCKQRYAKFAVASGATHMRTTEHVDTNNAGQDYYSNFILSSPHWTHTHTHTMWHAEDHSNIHLLSMSTIS